MRIIGVDPGLTGALALLSGSDFVAVVDMPTLRIGKRTVIDHYGVARIVDGWMGGPKLTAWVEYVASSPQMGRASAFNFGQGFGVVIGVLAANFIPINMVTPPSWKTAMKARGEKDESRARAQTIWPAYSGLFSRVKDHGRADAALIGLYGSRQMAEAA